MIKGGRFEKSAADVDRDKRSGTVGTDARASINDAFRRRLVRARVAFCVRLGREPCNACLARGLHPTRPRRRTGAKTDFGRLQLRKIGGTMSDYLVYLNAFPTIQSDFQSIAKFMHCLMMRNVATSGWVIQDAAQRLSKPGCIIASPSYPADQPDTDQDYVHHWTRDAAIVALEFVALKDTVHLDDFVAFADAAQKAAASEGKPLDWAAFNVDGNPRTPWTAQSDGPALQSLVLIRAWSLLSGATKTTAAAVLGNNLNFLLDHYLDDTVNLWEETRGDCLFTRAVQLQCFAEALASSAALGLSAALVTKLTDAKNALTARIPNHWSDSDQRYRSIHNAPLQRGWDLDSDVVMAAVYGAIPCTDDRLLSTAAQVRAAFANPTSQWYYQINGQDAGLGMGPLIGRYPMDTYDGSVNNGETPGGHPWAPCTCAFAELYYLLAKVHKSGTPLVGSLARTFYEQIGIGSSTSPADAADLLKKAGDAMLRAVVRHSDHLELSEQFNGNSGFELGVRDLTWSYASFMSAVRARNAI